MAEQHFLKHNDTRSWIQDFALMLSISKEVPWYLEDGSGRVYVVGARGATGLELTVASEAFEESGRSLVRGTLDYLQGLKMLGVKRVERVLPTGTALTVVGEAVKDDRGILRIQRPHKGPFYVSPRSIDQLIANLGRWSRWYKYLPLGFTAFSIYMITSNVVKYFLEKRRRAAFQRRVLEAAAQRLENGVEADALRDGSAANTENETTIMKDKCGHLCCCTSCSSQLSNFPLCWRHIDQVVKTYCESLRCHKSYHWQASVQIFLYSFSCQYFYSSLLFTRCERETLMRLPRTGAILFTIRTYIKPLSVIESWPALAAEMVTALTALPKPIFKYKTMAGFYHVALEYLQSCANLQT